MNDYNTIETKTKKITDGDIEAAIGRAGDDWIPFDDEYGVERELVAALGVSADEAKEAVRDYNRRHTDPSQRPVTDEDIDFAAHRVIAAGDDEKTFNIHDVEREIVATLGVDAEQAEAAIKAYRRSGTYVGLMLALGRMRPSKRTAELVRGMVIETECVNELVSLIRKTYETWPKSAGGFLVRLRDLMMRENLAGKVSIGMLMRAHDIVHAEDSQRAEYERRSNATLMERGRHPKFHGELKMKAEVWFALRQTAKLLEDLRSGDSRIITEMIGINGCLVDVASKGAYSDSQFAVLS
jgi:hypothetical protein